MSNSGLLTKTSSEKLKNENAIILSRQEVIELRNRKIFNWKNSSEVLALKFGLPALAFSNLITNTAINLLFRKNFLLKNANSAGGFVSSVLVTGVFPSATSAALLGLYYTNNLLSSSPADCLICQELKSVGFHLAIGSVIPTLLAWNTNYFQASVYKTYVLPKFDWLKESKTRAKFWHYFKLVLKDTTKNSYNRIAFCFSFQVIFATAVFYFQQKEFHEYIEPQTFSLSEIKQIKVI